MHLTSRDLTNLIIALQAVISLLIAIRAFSFYFRTRSTALLALGLSMGIIAIGGITGVIDDPFLNGNPTFNTIWFRHIGQTAAYAFIFLASLGGSEKYRQELKRWHIIATILLLILMFLTPVLPGKQPREVTGILSAIRCIACMATFFSYLAIFLRKSTRFSLLMSASFFLMGISLWLYTMKFFMPENLLFDYLSDGMRLAGLILLYLTFFIS
ncbi:hypothetical protein EPA93_39985 [Ktedonosporobacter rubrisoli]|uniref:DUF998 domain-containing protein n=1 Tax=Ktedonosporobacter rubrisoli TaxID=2509675 RepID=A0A4P6K102_KTERU|nr:hypothetical protein [Ktedonosporobacter rubrisoli]QBD81827.1 hypothetical protein EPA93_39985 [Ktedonosporobacter rubrisoli]